MGELDHEKRFDYIEKDEKALLTQLLIKITIIQNMCLWVSQLGQTLSSFTVSKM